ncbi:hypothetical protein GCM10023191_031880 [Actinoallomurus oryzae]|uniref:AraC family transcriptional regulator n=1 Tax=Actinoallomurus oryzae TaxID=502180 RepID=A0ABP8PXA7_9ACTN
MACLSRNPSRSTAWIGDCSNALVIDGRIPVRRVAAVPGVSDQTFARRYRWPHTVGVHDAALFGIEMTAGCGCP